MRLMDHSKPLWTPLLNASQCERCGKFGGIKQPSFDQIEWEASRWHVLQESDFSQGLVDYWTLCPDCYALFKAWVAKVTE